MHFVISISYLVVLLDPSGLGSLSITMANAGHAASHNLQAMHLCDITIKMNLTFLLQLDTFSKHVLLWTMDWVVLFPKDSWWCAMRVRLRLERMKWRVSYIRFHCSPCSKENRWPSQFSHVKVTIQVFSNISRIYLSREFISHWETHILLVFKSLGIKEMWIVIFAILSYCVHNI